MTPRRLRLIPPEWIEILWCTPRGSPGDKDATDVAFLDPVHMSAHESVIRTSGTSAAGDIKRWVVSFIR